MTRPLPLRAWLRGLGSLRLATTLIALVFLEVLAGTILEARQGLWTAHRLVFGNWWGGIPLLCALATANLLASLATRFRWSWRNAGLATAHLGLIGLLLSGGIGSAFSRSGSIDLGPGESTEEARHPGRWEIAATLHARTGAVQQARLVDGAKTGSVLDFGPNLGWATVRSVSSNGLVGMDGQTISLPRTDDPATRIPALVLDWTDAASRPATVVLDRNRPMSALGGGALVFLQETREPLPFRIALQEFHREIHPGSTRPRSFESRVTVRDGGGAREAVIRMNHPLRLHGWTLYQSSWREDERTGAERSILSAVRNPAGSWPYWSTLLIGLGLALHILPRLRPRRAAVPAILLAMAGASPAASAPRGDLPPVPRSLRELPVQIDGRVKTFETFASHTLLQLSGRTTVAGLDASRWLAALLLDPRRAADLPVFLVENPDTRDALGLSGAKERDRHSWRAFDAAAPTLETLARMAGSRAPENRSAVDREVLRLSDAWFRYQGLVMALAFLRTESVASHPAPPAPTFLALALESERFAGLIDSLASIDSTRRTPAQDSLLAWFRATFEQDAAWKQAEFPVLPWPDSASRPWATPGTRILEEGLSDTGLRRSCLDWNALRTAWMAGDTAGAERAATSLRAASLARGGAQIRPAALEAESWYNRTRPFLWAMVLFLAAFVPAAIGAWRERARWCRVGDALSALGLAFLAAGMALRMVVTLRPPVTNLYETFLFVAAVAVPALALPSLARGWLAGSPLAALTGFILLLLARGFGVDGDTMPVLVAVLDSNFWLIVHVLTITIGYGGVLAAGIAAHWHLWRLRRGHPASNDVVVQLAAFGLFFTFVGTLLGGIWADQSWGRFWGWDPKENGALLIVLWIAGVFHARASGLLGSRGFSGWTAAGIATVLFAWFGVNLLGMGLHSYGFTEGTFHGLAAYALAEAAFLVWACPGDRACLGDRACRDLPSRCR